MKNLRIRNWDTNFENASSRKLKRLDWVAIPNRMDGAGYTALVDHPNGAAHLGAWLAIVEIASRQGSKAAERGIIPEGAGGICQTLGRISRLPGRIFEEVIPRLIEIGWVEQLADNKQSPNASAGSPTSSADSPNTSAKSGSTGKGMEGKEGEGKKPPAPVVTMPQPFDFDARYLAIYDKHVTIGWIQDGRYEYTKALTNGSLPPEKIADVIDAAHADWMAFFNENPEVYRPGIGKWLKEGYWMRKAREPTKAPKKSIYLEDKPPVRTNA